MPYHVYILANKTGTVLYTGVTGKLEIRLFQHMAKLQNGFTKKYNVNRLMWYQVFDSPVEAISAEKIIKGWNRNKKLDLIREMNPKFRDLADPGDPSQARDDG